MSSVGPARGQAPSPSSVPVRIQKYLSQAGVASRRQAERLIGQGRVFVNGRRVAEYGVRVTPGTDTVVVDGKKVLPAPRRWIVFHKPPGVLCTRTDPHGGSTIYDVLPEWALGLRYVGRLDRDTSGLILLTNDGDLAAALAHPRNRVEREYVAEVGGAVTARVVRALKRGAELEDGFARPKRVRRADFSPERPALSIVMTEGRKREVRRLLRAVGHPVVTLSRVRFGPFRLGGLDSGSWRPARGAELNAARTLVARRRRRAPARSRPGAVRPKHGGV